MSPSAKQANFEKQLQQGRDTAVERRAKNTLQNIIRQDRLNEESNMAARLLFNRMSADEQDGFVVKYMSASDEEDNLAARLAFDSMPVDRQDEFIIKYLSDRKTKESQAARRLLDILPTHRQDELTKRVDAGSGRSTQQKRKHEPETAVQRSRKAAKTADGGDGASANAQQEPAVDYALLGKLSVIGLDAVKAGVVKQGELMTALEESDNNKKRELIEIWTAKLKARRAGT